MGYECGNSDGLTKEFTFDLFIDQVCIGSTNLKNTEKLMTSMNHTPTTDSSKSFSDNARVKTRLMPPWVKSQGMSPLQKTLLECERREHVFRSKNSEEETEIASTDTDALGVTDDLRVFDDQGPVHQVFDAAALKILVKTASTQDGLKARVRELQNLSPFRPLSVIPEDVVDKLSELKGDWPNFSDVIDQISCDLALSKAMAGEHEPAAISFTPMLLVGPPGCGKSSFMEALAAAIGLQMYRQSLERMMTSADLLGSSRMYSNSEPGAFFNLMTGTGGIAQAYPANFLMACDELDKLTGDPRYKPASALLSLLETSTNSRIVDGCALIEMDLSRVNYLFTANELHTDSMSQPVLSRLLIKHIQPLSFEQMCDLSVRLYSDLVAQFKLPEDQIPQLTESGIIALTKCGSVREQKSLLRQAMGKALIKGQSSLHFEEVPEKSMKRIGFI